MRRHLLDRRTLLRGMLGGAAISVGLPALEIMLNTHGEALAGGDGLPKRFGLFYWGNGVRLEQWTPSTVGADYTLPPLLEPLADVRHRVTVVTGLFNPVLNQYPHFSGAAGMLSGRDALSSGDTQTFAGPSLDQVVASSIGGDTRFRSLELAASDARGLSYNGPYNRNPPEWDPAILFARVFGEGYQEPGSEPIYDPTLALRRSVLDAVMQDARALDKRLGAADRVRLDQHLAGVRDLELRLARMEEAPPDLAACITPDEPTEDFSDIGARPQISARSRAMVDLLVMALACDQTRVFSHWMCDPIGNPLFPGASDGFHNLTHSEKAPQPEVLAIVTQIVAEFAYLVGALEAVEEGASTLLDHCVVLGTSDVSDGLMHSMEEFPILLAGNADGALVEGIHHRDTQGSSTSKVALSLLHALDIPSASYGVDHLEASDGLGAIEL